jgi:hypothetical protein
MSNRTLGTGSDINAWRHTEERAELVERVIAAEARCQLFERALREYGQEPNYINALLARIVGLEANQDRLLAQVAGLESKLRKSA